MIYYLKISVHGVTANRHVFTCPQWRGKQLSHASVYLSHASNIENWTPEGLLPIPLSGVILNQCRVAFCTRHMPNDSQSQSTFAASQPVKRHVKIWRARQKTDDVKIGRHMKGWTLCQKETLNQWTNSGSLKLKFKFQCQIDDRENQQLTQLQMNPL